MKLISFLILVIIVQSCQINSEPKLDADKIRIELDSIMKLDQLHRNELNDLFKQYGFDSDEFQDIFREQKTIDSFNLIYVEDLIKNYGKYPGKSFVGQSTGEVAFFVLQHAPDSIQSKYINLILDASKENELKKGSVAMYYDRYLIGKGEPQIYGTQIGSKEIKDSLTGEIKRIHYKYPIRDTVKLTRYVFGMDY